MKDRIPDKRRCIHAFVLCVGLLLGIGVFSQTFSLPSEEASMYEQTAADRVLNRESGTRSASADDLFADRLSQELVDSALPDEMSSLGAFSLTGESAWEKRLDAYAVSPEDAPRWFTVEVGLPTDACDVKATENWLIVGFELCGGCEQIKKRLIDWFDGRGWTSFGESGEVVSFMKDKGEQRWMLMNCMEFQEICAITLFFGNGR